jgi:hypothetical protein
MTNPYVHQAIISADAPPRPACGGSGRSVARAADVTCPACLALAADRKARTEVHDTHAIPAGDELQPGDWVDVSLRHAMVERVTHDDGEVILTFGHEAMSDVVAVVLNDDITATVRTEAEVLADHAKRCPSCSHCGKTFHVEDTPAKTHDLSVRKGDDDNLVITVENEKDDIRVYIPTGFALDLGRALAHLTPAQIALLIGELKGGEK